MSSSTTYRKQQRRLSTILTITSTLHHYRQHQLHSKTAVPSAPSSIEYYIIRMTRILLSQEQSSPFDGQPYCLSLTLFTFFSSHFTSMRNLLLFTSDTFSFPSFIIIFITKTPSIHHFVKASTKVHSINKVIHIFPPRTITAIRPYSTTLSLHSHVSSSCKSYRFIYLQVHWTWAIIIK